MRADSANAVLAIVGADLDAFSSVNAVTALYRIARSLTSRAGRLRRKEAAHVTADARFARLVESVELFSRELDRVGLENRKWAYHKLMLPSEYRARAALAVRALDKARDLQGDLVDAMDVESVLVAVEDHAEIFNKVNVSTALHRVARLVTTRGMNQHGGGGGGSEHGEASSSAVSSSSAKATSLSASRAPHHTASSLMSDARFAKLMTLVEEKAGEMSAVSVSNALWATARLRYPASEALVEKLASRAATECAKAEPRHLSTVLWALAVLGHEPRSRLLAAVAERALETSGKFRAPDIVNMLWAYARWSPRGSSSSAGGGSGAGSSSPEEDPAANADVVRALCAQALANLADFTPYQCANLAWSLAMLDAPIPGGASRGLGAILDRAASDPGSLDPTALTHALWAVGVKGTASDGNSGAFKTLLAEAASRAKRRAIGRAGAAGVVWACGRLRVTPRPGDAEALLGRLLDDRGGGAEAQALVHAVWGVSQMEGVTMGEKHREETIGCVERLAREGRVSAAHAEALRASAAGAGVDPTRMEAALRAT